MQICFKGTVCVVRLSGGIIDIEKVSGQHLSVQERAAASVITFEVFLNHRRKKMTNPEQDQGHHHLDEWN